MLTKLFIFFFILGTLNVVKEIYALFIAITTRTKLVRGKWDTLLLGASISYIITMLITGFGI